LKCSVCAQDVPEDRYSEHLESEHGVTDDPTAVLIQHLTGLHSRGGEGDGDESLPDDEPSDADAFEEFLAAHPADSEDEDEDGEPAAAAPSRAPVQEGDEHQGDEHDEAPEDEQQEPEPQSDDSAEAGGEEMTDEDEAEFERMLAVAPQVDLRKSGKSGRRKGRAKKAEPAAPASPASSTAPATAAAATTATTAATADRDEATFAVWDEARGATDEDEDVLLVVPPAEIERVRRRRQLALLGLGAAIILVAIAVIYLLTRDTGTKNNTTATAPVATVATTVPPTFLPGPQGGAPTTAVTQPPITVAPPATTPTTAAPPATTAAPATTAPPSGDPASRIAFSYSSAQCSPQGSFAVSGTITNNNSGSYSFSYTITLLRNDGVEQGRATGQVNHLAPGGHFSGQIGTGSCSYPLSPGRSPQQTITSITPG
jgi:hypothetical protein